MGIIKKNLFLSITILIISFFVLTGYLVRNSIKLNPQEKTQIEYYKVIKLNEATSQGKMQITLQKIEKCDTLNAPNNRAYKPRVGYEFIKCYFKLKNTAEYVLVESLPISLETNEGLGYYETSYDYNEKIKARNIHPDVSILKVVAFEIPVGREFVVYNRGMNNE